MPTLTESPTTIDSALSIFLDSSPTSSVHIGETLNKSHDKMITPFSSSHLAHRSISSISLLEMLEKNWRQGATSQPEIDFKIIQALLTSGLVLYFDAPPHVTQDRPNETVATTRLSPHLRAITWIHHATGMSEQRLADLVGVSRMTIRNWKAGSPIRRRDYEARLFQVKDVLERAQRNHPNVDELSSWLVTPSLVDGTTPEELLKQGNFDKARALALLTNSHVSPTPQWARDAASSPWAHNLEVREKPEDLSDSPN